MTSRTSPRYLFALMNGYTPIHNAAKSGNVQIVSSVMLVLCATSKQCHVGFICKQ